MTEHESIIIQSPLLATLKAWIEEHQFDRVDGFVDMNEKRYKPICEFKVEIWPNESQHRGAPHCKISIDGRSATFLISDGSKLAGNLGHRELAASKAIRIHKEGLMRMWKDTRPDDQKL